MADCPPYVERCGIAKLDDINCEVFRAIRILDPLPVRMGLDFPPVLKDQPGRFPVLLWRIVQSGSSSCSFFTPDSVSPV